MSTAQACLFCGFCPLGHGAQRRLQLEAALARRLQRLLHLAEPRPQALRLARLLHGLLPAFLLRLGDCLLPLPRQALPQLLERLRVLHALLGLVALAGALQAVEARLGLLQLPPSRLQARACGVERLLRARAHRLGGGRGEGDGVREGARHASPCLPSGTQFLPALPVPSPNARVQGEAGTPGRT